jgi:hypothetical protein
MVKNQTASPDTAECMNILLDQDETNHKIVLLGKMTLGKLGQLSK